jgi:hypothetical protein
MVFQEPASAFLQDRERIRWSTPAGDQSISHHDHHHDKHQESSIWRRRFLVIGASSLRKKYEN